MKIATKQPWQKSAISETLPEWLAQNGYFQAFLRAYGNGLIYSA